MSDDYSYAELAAVPIDLRAGDGQTEQDGAPDDDR